MSVGATILEQLGGNQFVLLTGAKQFTTNGSDLTFRFGSRGRGMRITLNGNDLYDIDYFMIRGMEVKDLGAERDVYCDMLQDVFEKMTGLYVTLHARKAAA